MINPVTPVEVFPRNRKSKKPVIVNKTSFPGYIFVDLKGQSWRELKPVKNVFGVLVRDSEPFLLRKEQISEIVLAPEKKVDAVKIGDKVTFKSGPFQNIPATYQSKGKINIFVFGSSRLMVVDPSLLVKFEELKK